MTLYAGTHETSGLVVERSPEHAIELKHWQKYGGEVLMSSIPSIRWLSPREEEMAEQSTAPTYISFPTTREEKKRISTVIPPLEGLDVDRPALTLNVRNLLRNFWAIIVSEALQASFPVRKTAVAVFDDRAEDRRQVVLRIFTEASASQAVAFWEGLENDIQDWLTGLDDRNRLIFLRDISLRVHWQ